jgi:hypothetical protein
VLLLTLLLACAVDTSTPRAVPYDHVACGHCGMMVSEPRFAAQLFERDGAWHAFDDPACALRYVAEKGPSVASLWFHDGKSDDETWIAWDRVGFVPATGAPMDGGLAAVPSATEGAITVGAASSKLVGGGR